MKTQFWVKCERKSKSIYITGTYIHTEYWLVFPDGRVGTKTYSIGDSQKQMKDYYMQIRGNGPFSDGEGHFPGDGVFSDEIQKQDSCCGLTSKKHRFVRYEEGSRDRAWMEARDRKYVLRLEQEGRLDTIEPNLKNEIPLLYMEIMALRQRTAEEKQQEQMAIAGREVELARAREAAAQAEAKAHEQTILTAQALERHRLRDPDEKRRYEQEKRDDITRQLIALKQASISQQANFSQINQQYDALEGLAFEFNYVNFFIQRADFCAECADKLIHNLQKEVLYKKAILSYQRALSMDPFVEGLAAKLEQMQARLGARLSAAAATAQQGLHRQAPVAPPSLPTRAELTPEQAAQIEREKERLRSELAVGRR